MAKWIRRRFPEPKIEGSSPFRDASFQRTSGLVGYDVCLTRRRSPVRSRACVVLLVPAFLFDTKCKRLSSHWRALIAQMVERKTLNLVVVGSIPTEGAFLLGGSTHFVLRGWTGGRCCLISRSRFSSVGRASD